MDVTITAQSVCCFDGLKHFNRYKQLKTDSDKAARRK